MRAAAVAEQKIRIKLKAYDAQLLQQSVGLISDAATSTGARVSGPVYLPTRCLPWLQHPVARASGAAAHPTLHASHDGHMHVCGEAG